MDTQDLGQTAQPQSVSGASTASDAANSREQLNYPDDQPKVVESEQQKAAPEEKPKVAPEKVNQPDKPTDHEYQLQMPDGVQMDADLLSSAVPMLRDAGISNDQANKLVHIVPKMQERLLKQLSDDHLVRSADWAKSAKTDREIGGEHWKETSRLAGVALKAGGAVSMTHEARQVLNESGLGNHPAMVRLFRRMGAEIERLRRHAGHSLAGRPVSREEAMYPNDQPAR